MGGGNASAARVGASPSWSTSDGWGGTAGAGRWPAGMADELAEHDFTVGARRGGGGEGYPRPWSIGGGCSSPQGNNPLAPLAEFVPVSNDVGLHIVLARNSGGGSKSLYEPIIGKMRETSAPGLAMSANKDDGQLVANIKSRPLPPGRGTLVSRSLRAGPADDPDDSSRLSKGRCSRRTGGRTASPSDDRTDAGERQAAVSGIAAQYGVQPHGPARRGAASVGSARPRTATIVSGNSRSYDGVVMASHSIKIVFATLTCECVQGQRRCAGVSLLGASSADQAVARSSPAAGSLRAAG